MAKSKLFKNISAFTDKAGIRPILSGIYFCNNGNVYATNSHIAVRVRGLNVSGNEMVLHPDSLEQLQGCYPDVDRLIPSTNSDIAIELSSQQVNQILTFCKPVKKEIVTVSLQSGQLVMSSGQTNTVTAVQGLDNQLDIHFKADYLSTALTLFKDEKVGQLSLHVYSSSRPVLFASNNIDVVVCPVRQKQGETA